MKREANATPRLTCFRPVASPAPCPSAALVHAPIPPSHVRRRWFAPCVTIVLAAYHTPSSPIAPLPCPVSPFRHLLPHAVAPTTSGHRVASEPPKGSILPFLAIRRPHHSYPLPLLPQTQNRREKLPSHFRPSRLAVVQPFRRASSLANPVTRCPRVPRRFPPPPFVLSVAVDLHRRRPFSSTSGLPARPCTSPMAARSPCVRYLHRGTAAFPHCPCVHLSSSPHVSPSSPWALSDAAIAARGAATLAGFPFAGRLASLHCRSSVPPPPPMPLEPLFLP